MRSFSSSSRRRFALATFLVLGLADFSLPGASNPHRRAKSPNIIFILADDLGYGDLGCYGQTNIKTPNLDRMAAEGMRFTQCYAGSTVCAPSRSTLMTGQHTGHTRIRGNSAQPLLPEDLTVAELLKSAGYRTGAIGKWGLGNEFSTGTPNKKGFDEWYGYLNQTHAHNYYPTSLWRNERMLELHENENNKKQVYSHDTFTKAALNFIRINADRSFFLYLPYTIPHAHNKLGKETGNGMEVPSDEPYSSQPWTQVEKNKAAMITRLDRDVGQLLDHLKRYRIDGETVVFFSSDNGPHKEGGVNPAFFGSSGPLRGIKRDLYEGGIRVPMIVRWPGRIKAAQTNDHVWAFWDFLPTAAELAGAVLPGPVDGRSVLPVLLGKPQAPTEYLYWEFHEGGSRQAVRTGDWKGIKVFEKPLELYNLKLDLHEDRNVAAENPAVVQKIETYIKLARSESPQWPLKGPPPKKPAAKDGDEAAEAEEPAPKNPDQKN